MMAVSSLRVQNRRAALVALVNQLRPAQNAIILLLKKMREIAAFWAQTIAIQFFCAVFHDAFPDEDEVLYENSVLALESTAGS